MRRTQEYLEKYLNVKHNTIDLYLCRLEFKHIKRYKEKKTWYYDNITFNDIETMYNLIKRRRRR